MTKQAPEARLAFRAKFPEFLPITSIKNRRLCELAVSLILSTDSTIVSNAVLYPMEKSVPKTSLSIEAGIPITGTLNSSEKTLAPVKEPLPQITTKAFMP